MQQRVRSRARNERAVDQVISVRENFTRDLQTLRLAGTREGAVFGRKQNQFGIDRFRGARDRIGQVLIACRHVVECAVWFDMVWSYSGGRGDRLKNAELIDYCVKDVFGGHFQFLATEIFPIEKTRMRSNGNPASL